MEVHFIALVSCDFLFYFCAFSLNSLLCTQQARFFRQIHDLLVPFASSFEDILGDAIFHAYNKFLHSSQSARICSPPDSCGWCKHSCNVCRLEEIIWSWLVRTPSAIVYSCFLHFQAASFSCQSLIITIVIFMAQFIAVADGAWFQNWFKVGLRCGKPNLLLLWVLWVASRLSRRATWWVVQWVTNWQSVAGRFIYWASKYVFIQAASAIFRSIRMRGASQNKTD